MTFFSEIRELFQFADIIIAECLNTSEASFTVAYNSLPKSKLLQKVLKGVPNRDKITLAFITDGGDKAYFTNHQTEAFDYSVMSEGLLPEDNIDIKVQIDKTVADGKFSIYDYESFITDLLSRPIPEIMHWYSEWLKGQESLMFEVFDFDISLASRTIAFESCENATFSPKITRTQRLSVCKDTASFYNMSEFEVTPDDFIIEGIVRGGDKILPLFGKLSTILSLAYVASSASINHDSINVQINGQRTVSYDLPLVDIKEDEKWQNIYTWIFTDGNPTDKALIAHNVISLHCKFETLISLDATVFEAIKTNYNLYLRSNVNQYLDLKRDLAKFIQNVVSQVGDYAVAILGKFKNNLFAIVGFLFTVVLVRIGNTQKWDEIFTKHTIYLFELFLFGSLFYLGICFFETRFKLKKTKKSYTDLKENYKDVLSKTELMDAFKDDRLLTETENSTKKGMIGWSITWGLFLVLTIIIIEVFTANHGLIVWLWDKIF